MEWQSVRQADHYGICFFNQLSIGDCILADRGFLIQEELSVRGAVLKVPKFTRGKKQLSHKDVDKSRQLVRVRITFLYFSKRIVTNRQLN